MAGEAEFDGGGSVKWKIKNGDGEPPTKCDKDGSHGKDKDPKGANPIFRVWLNGAVQFTAPATQGNTIKVEWLDGPMAQARSAE